ncbi:aminoacyl-tRNA deacylase [Paenibacillus puldeungensis]|uniref:Aminoacyl-tRNA deacylase n=1 Tax=Paenibacillus puldeungensis TaxID=696536 RepID=A0ABW3S1V1_9BACL
MDKLIAFLDQQGIDYEIIEHRQQINTAQEGADYFGIHIGQTAPTLILKTDNGFFALIISGDFGRVDFEQLKALLQVQQIKLAKPQEVEAVTGSKIGSVSLIQHHLPIIMDRELYRFDYVYGGTGFPNTTLKIRPNDLEKLVKTIAFIR